VAGVGSADSTGDIFEINWSRRGDKLAACYSNGKLALIDVRV
jgi:hypothetical protein